MLRQQAQASFEALQHIRSEAHLFWDRMLVDARTLCDFHVQKIEEVRNHFHGELTKERSKLYAGTNEHREKLEKELLSYQKKLTKTVICYHKPQNQPTGHWGQRWKKYPQSCQPAAFK
eukprot:4512067-Amphidinium_carterae.1